MTDPLIGAIVHAVLRLRFVRIITCTERIQPIYTTSMAIAAHWNAKHKA